MNKLITKAFYAFAFFSIILLNNVNSQTVVGYFDASLSEAGTRLTQLKWNSMTDFIYGFVQPDGNGNLPDPTTLSHFNTSKTYCANNNVKMHFSSGGATYSSIFLTIGNSPTASANYAKEIADILETHNIIGFDLDWEFPRTSAERTAHVNILKAVHDEFTARGKRDEWEIAIAVGGETPSVGAQGVYHTDYCSPDAFQYIDYLNLMAYDVGYGISGNDPNHSSYADAQANVVDWVNKGCPIEKIVLGVPFYARHSSNRGASIYAHAYSNLSSGDPAAAYNSDNVGAYYYNGRQTLIDKVNYIMNQGGHGIMIWEVTYDRTDQYSLLDVLAEAMLPYQCAAPKPNLGNDQSICGLSSVTLDGGIATAAGRTFTWKKDGSAVVTNSPNANTYNATSSGNYTLEVNENGCFQSDEITVTGNLGSIDLGGPYELCSPVSVDLSTGMSTAGKSFEWTKNSVVIDGADQPSYTAFRSGTYEVTISASGCPSISASAVVTSSAPYADNVVVCSAGEFVDITASEQVNWYATEVSETILETAMVYQYEVTENTTLWMGGTGVAATEYNTMKSDFAAGWQANSQVYAQKIIVETELTMDAVTLHPNSGAVTINLVADNGTTVVHTKSYPSTSGKQEFALGWTVTPGTYYINCVGTSGNVWVDNTLDASNYVINGVITVERACYADWSAPYGDAYQASLNYGNFVNLKITVGSACDRVPVNVTIDENDPDCLITSSLDVDENKVLIFPNPSSTSFEISGLENSSINVYNSNGSLIDSFTTNGNIVFGEGYFPGIYFVQIQNNSTVKSYKIIKN